MSGEQQEQESLYMALANSKGNISRLGDRSLVKSDGQMFPTPEMPRNKLKHPKKNSSELIDARPTEQSVSPSLYLHLSPESSFVSMV